MINRVNRHRPGGGSILLVDDDPTCLAHTSALLRATWPDAVLTCRDSREALDMLAAEPVTVALLDLAMPHLNGEQLLALIRRQFPDLPVVIISGSEELQTAVRCIKKGAFDYIVKPIDPSRLTTVLSHVMQRAKARAGHEPRKAVAPVEVGIRAAVQSAPVVVPLPRTKARDGFAGIVTDDHKMRSLFDYVESVAPTSEPVLITGETGVGKELFAKALHDLSGCAGPFVAVNMAGLDDATLADTLFGHARGAFANADQARPGLIEKAAYGTLFLDEIGDVTPASQAKLLRLLQSGEYLPLGSDGHKRCHARIVAATNQNLWTLVEQGRFRQDLNYRLRTHHAHVPPLRERLDDLPLLVAYFVDSVAQQLRKPRPGVGETLLERLKSHSFPGNVRELRAMLFDAISVNRGEELTPDLFEAHMQRSSGIGAGDSLPADTGAGLVTFSERLPTQKEINMLLLNEALRRARGNQALAGRMIGITQQAVSKRLKNLGGASAAQRRWTYRQVTSR